MFKRIKAFFNPPPPVRNIEVLDFTIPVERDEKHNHKLSDADKKCIKAMDATGRWQRQFIAAMFGISPSTVSAICGKRRKK